MAVTEGQDPGAMFEQLHGQFLIDLNGDGQPDVAVPQGRVQVAGGYGRGVGLGIAGGAAASVPPLIDMKFRDKDSVVGRMLTPQPDAGPRPQPQPGRRMQGGLLDKLEPDGVAIAQPQQEDVNPLMRGVRAVNQGLSLADHYLMNIPSTAAGLVNAAIPGQPLGGVEEAQAASRSGLEGVHRDLVGAPVAFGGMGPGTFAKATGALGRNRLMGPEPWQRGERQGVPLVYQKPQDYFPNEIKSPSGPPPEPNLTPRQAGVDFYGDLYQGDTPGTAGRALVDRIGSNRANMPIFSDNKRFAPHALAEIKARVAAGDAAAAEQWQRLKVAAAEYYGLDIETMKPLQPSSPQARPPRPSDTGEKQ